jgi:riboflavin kinase/FMN adenylyltransferase
MKVFRSLASVRIEEDSCLAWGVFDGVHLGHQRLLRRVVDVANGRGILPLAVTFDPHPAALFSPQGAPPLLTTTEEKLELFRQFGIKTAFVVPFTQAFANMMARDFIKRILLDKLKARYVVVGIEASFGKGAHGTTAMLTTMGEQMGFQVELMEPVYLDKAVVSSTALREALSKGDVALALRMLGRPYRLSGTVVKGSGRGTSLGFPTANLRPPKDKVIPPDGIYACIIRFDDETAKADASEGDPTDEHVAVVYIGHRPTFGGGDKFIEVHICEENLKLHGKQLEISFVSQLREDMTFSSGEALTQQMAQDARLAFERVSEFYSREN